MLVRAVICDIPRTETDVHRDSVSFLLDEFILVLKLV